MVWDALTKDMEHIRLSQVTSDGGAKVWNEWHMETKSPEYVIEVIDLLTIKKILKKGT